MQVTSATLQEPAAVSCLKKYSRQDVTEAVRPMQHRMGWWFVGICTINHGPVGQW